MLFCELLRFERVIWSDGGGNVTVGGLSPDSRSCQYGTLFFCIRGAWKNGHDFAGDAYARGCRHFVAEHPLPLPSDASVLVCSSPRRKMAILAARYYGDPAKDMRVIGITGTKGKTTTAQMLRGILEGHGVPTAYMGTSGVEFAGEHIATEHTTPPSTDLFRYLRMIRDRGIKTVVMELSSQALAYDRAYGLPVYIGVFTNLSRDHIGYGEHESMTAYRAAKMRLFTEFAPKEVVLNAEDSFSTDILRVRAGEACRLYGNGDGSTLRYRGVRYHKNRDRLCTSFLLAGGGVSREVTIDFAGEHYILDLLAALSAASLAEGVPWETLLTGAGRISVPGRCETFFAENGAMLVIDYAHNGASLAAALRGLRPYASGRLLCLFGAVGDRARCRRADMAAAAERYADFSVITTDNPGNEDVSEIIGEIQAAFSDSSRFCAIPDRTEAIRYLLRVSRKGDVVLFAGKGDEKYQLLLGKKVPFSEREIIKNSAFSQKQK